MPLRPIDSAGQRFVTSQPLMIISWLQDEGFTLTLDAVEQVELSLEDERIRIDADGNVTTAGERADRAARRLLLHSEES